MKKNYVVLFIAIPLLLIVIAGISACKKKQQNFTWLDFYIGGVEVMKQDGSVEPAEIKKLLFRDDAVWTADNSVAFIQCGTGSLIQVFQNTEFKMSALPDKLKSSGSITELNLINGKAGFNVEKLSKGGSFSVKTPSIVAAIRATIFLVEQNDDTSTVIVKKGSVAIASNTGEFKEFLIQKGQKAKIRGKVIQISNITGTDNAHFKDISLIRPLPNIIDISPEGLEKHFKEQLNRGLRQERRVIEGEKSSREDTSPEPVRDKPEKAADRVKARVAVNLLAANGVPLSEAEDISKKIYTRLRAIKGKEKVVYRRKFDERSANRILTGRVSKLGKSRIIAVNVLDGEKGSVLYNKSTVVKEDDNLDARIQGIIKEISSQGNIWE